MPNEPLIAALTALREDYGQRQKAVHSLIAALKGKSSAFSKIQQALNDYSMVNPDAHEALVPLQQSFTTAQDYVSPLTTSLARQAKSLATFTSALKGAIAALSSDPDDVVRLSHPVEALKTSDVQDQRLVELLPELTRELEAAEQALGAVFGAALREAFAAQGIEVAGNPPRFEVERFEIAANFITRSASISYGAEPVVKRVPLSVEAILKAFQAATRSISGRSENAESWIAQFYSAWESARVKRKTADKRANIVDCYFEMVLLRQPKTFFSAPAKGNFAEYTRPQFAYDLFEIAIRPQREHKGQAVFAHSATRSQTDSSTRSMWIVEGQGPHDGRYVGDIVFDKKE